MGLRPYAQAAARIPRVLRLGQGDLRGARQGPRRPVASMPGALDAFRRGRHRSQLEAGSELVAYAGKQCHGAAVSRRAARSGALAYGNPRQRIQSSLRVAGTKRSVISVAAAHAAYSIVNTHSGAL